MIAPSPIEQYLPIEITTCWPAVDLLKSPLSIAPDRQCHLNMSNQKRWEVGRERGRLT
jgi:hypothetical protein